MFRYDVQPHHLEQIAQLPADQAKVWWQSVWIGRATCVVAHAFLVAYFAYAPWWGYLPKSVWWLSLASTIYVFYLKFEFSHRLVAELRSSGPRYPLIGQLHVLLSNLIIDGGSQLALFDRSIVYMNSVKDLGDISGIWLFSVYPVVVVNTPAAARALTTMDPRDAPKNWAARFFLPWLGQGLLLSSGDEWKAQRRMLTPAFHFEVLKHYFDVVVKHGEVFAAKLDEVAGQETDLARAITNCTLDTIAECACGYDAGAQTTADSPYCRAVHTACELLAKQAIEKPYIPEWLWHLMPSGRAFLRSVRFMHATCQGIIDERRDARARGETQQGGFKDFLDILLEAKRPDGSPLPNKAVLDQVNTFVFEGHDTTSVALGWTIYEIATHPEIEARVVAEMEAVLGADAAVTPTFEQVKQLQYLDAVVKEGLRLNPPVPIVGRYLLKPLVVGDQTVPAGTEVAMSPYVIHRLEANFPDALRFNPDRFVSGGSANAVNPFAYIPFSAGSRNCIGQNFAMIEAKLLLCSVFRRFRVEVLEEPVAESQIVLRMKHGLRVRLSRR